MKIRSTKLSGTGNNVDVVLESSKSAVFNPLTEIVITKEIKICKSFNLTPNKHEESLRRVTK